MIALQESPALLDVGSRIEVVAEWVRLTLEAAGIVIIAVGAAGALWALARGALARRQMRFTPIRLRLARYLTLALEFQLAADILETAIAPEWPKIAQLAAIAAIRTALNYFLSREMREERAATAGESALPAA
jgi:uncharacterized membrane protein